MHQTRRAKLEYKFGTCQITAQEWDELEKLRARRSRWSSWSTFLLVALAAAALLALTGCDEQEGRPDQTPVPSFYSVNLYIDPDTGCQYLAQYRGGITPRLDRDGKQICK